MTDRDSTWRQLGSRPIYHNRWITVEMADIVLPSGERQEHHTVSMPSAAMTVVLDNANDAVLLSWRHRFVSDVWNWELPGGIVDADESPEQAATREVIEETGHRPLQLAHLVTFEPMIGMVTSPHHVFIAHGVEKISEPTERNEGRFEWVSADRVSNLIRNGDVCNSGTMVGLLYWLALRGGQELSEPPALPR
jgi:8-oxo-dGDP phosphatase